LCKELHISENTYKRWKDGESRSYGTHIVKISEYLGVTPDYILCGDLKDKELLEEFHKLNNDNKELIVKAIKQLRLKGYVSSE
jgi:transcriptional regulator with XRE-family HTH domain